MSSEPDPDWYLDHVLYYAEPGSASPSASPIRVDEVTRWEVWWRSQAAAVRSEWPDLAHAALSQGFALTSQQVSALGMGRPKARGLVERGRWGALVRGAVTLVGPAAVEADRPDRWTADRRRHALAGASAALVNPGHVVIANTAAVLHGLPVYALPKQPELAVPREATVPRSQISRRRGARIAGLAPGDVTTWNGVPCTNVQRTVVDIARSGRRDGIVVADAALRTRRVTRSQLDAALARARGWPGVRQAGEIVALADPRGESPLESILRLAIHDAGLPSPELQVWLAAPGRHERYRVDMLWPEQRLIVEADGRVKYQDPGHSDDPLWTEKKREIALRRLGYRVERVLWSDVVTTWSATYVLLAEALGC